MSEEGFIELEHGRIWYRRSGGGDALPILLLHGGPGAAAYYLEPLEERLLEAVTLTSSLSALLGLESAAAVAIPVETAEPVSLSEPVTEAAADPEAPPSQN